ncbi:MAG: YlmC/YmxH family sporulation protein [Ruminococcus sp.]|nr:YlmC/YmxH family sporulation protein [Ruminococcus sp.]
MQYSLENIRNKEVIEITAGERLGYIDDVRLSRDFTTVTGFVIYGRERLFGLLGREEDIVIKCEEITVIGEDVMLIKREKEDFSAVSTKKRADLRESLFK